MSTPPESETPPQHVTAPTADDSTLDARSHDDADYLASLGYKPELKRALGLASSFAVHFSAIAVASALFTTVGVGFGYFGPASFWAFLIGGALQVFAVGIAVAELVSAYPLSGGVYQIVTRITRTPWLGWQTGWWISVAHIVSIPAISVAIAPAIAGWFGITFDSTTQSLPWVIGIIIAGTIVNVVGVRIAAFVNNLGVICELIGAAVIVVALLFVHHNVQPTSIFTNTAGTTSNGWLIPLLCAFALPAFIISAFDSTGNAGEETKNAARTAPLGQTLANIAGWAFGCLFFYLMIRAIPDVTEAMSSSTPGRFILESAVGSTITDIFEVTAVIALFACNCIIQLTGVRVMWAQARDGRMPFAGFMRKVNSASVPVNAALVSCVLAIVFAVWSSVLSVLTAMVALSWAAAYTVTVIVGFYALAKKRVPQRPFTTGRLWPLVFGVAIIWSIVLCVAIVLTDPLTIGGGMLAVIAAGTVVYLCIPKARRKFVSDPAPLNAP